MRSLVDSVRIEYDIERRAHVEDETGPIRSLRSRYAIEVTGVTRRQEAAHYGWDQLIGQGPSRAGVSLYDGRDTFAVTPAPLSAYSGGDEPPRSLVYVKAGRDSSLLGDHVLENFESAIWGDMLRPLDEVIEGGVFTVSVADESQMILGYRAYVMTFRVEVHGNAEIAAERWTVWVAPDLGMLPIRSTAEFELTNGGTRLINGKSARNFREIKPGLWIPTEITFADPREEAPATYTRLMVTSVSDARSRDVLLQELASGVREYIDFRTNERYIMDGENRGASSPIADAADVQRELDAFMGRSQVVAASQRTTNAKDGVMPTWAWVSLPVGLLIAFGVVRVVRKS
jgi:hypothetical protein